MVPLPRTGAVHEVSCRGGLGMVVGAFGVRVLEYSRKGDS